MNELRCTTRLLLSRSILTFIYFRPSWCQLYWLRSDSSEYRNSQRKVSKWIVDFQSVWYCGKENRKILWPDHKQTHSNTSRSEWQHTGRKKSKRILDLTWKYKSIQVFQYSSSQVVNGLASMGWLLIWASVGFWGFCGFLWGSMGFHGLLWASMGFYGLLCASMGFCGRRDRGTDGRSDGGRDGRIDGIV